MSNRDRSNRSFRWGVDPLFSRRVLLAPPTRVSGDSGPRRPRSARLAKRERPGVVLGASASVLFHGALIVWSSDFAFSTDGAAGLRDARVLTAPEPLQLVELVTPSLPEAEPASASTPSERALPVAVVEPPRLTVRKLMSAGVAGDPMTGADLRVPPGLGEATVAGTGEGTGAGAGEDDAPDVFIPPRARSILRTWRAHPAAVGTEVKARVYVDETGKTTGQVMLVQPTPHEPTNREILYRVQNLEYWPALVNGQPAAAWAEITFEFCYDGTTAASPPSPGFQHGEPCEEEPEVVPPVVTTRASGT